MSSPIAVTASPLTWAVRWQDDALLLSSVLVTAGGSQNSLGTPSRASSFYERSLQHPVR
jgi:hypothetical protein